MEPLPVQSQPVSFEPDPAPATEEDPEPPQLAPEDRELLERVANSLNQQHEANVYLDERIAGLKDTLEPLTLQLGGYIKALDSRIALLEDSVSRLTKQNPDPAATTTNESTEPTTTGPPFRLISIDRWQQKWNAVLELDGKTKMIEPPDEVAGWQLLSIDPNTPHCCFSQLKRQ